jgi:four helix bundle protein
VLSEGISPNGARHRNRSLFFQQKENTLQFDHEKLDVYCLSIDFTSWAYLLCKSLNGLDRHSRDQLLRASQSIPLNIAEGNGKRSKPDRKRFFEISRGSAFECCAILDVLLACNVIDCEKVEEGKNLLHRIVAMLSKMTETTRKGFYESSTDY